MSVKVAVTGSHGLIGRHLLPALAARGHEALRVVRGPAGAEDGPSISWDPAAGRLDPADLSGVDAVINLAGVGIGERRWNAAHKEAALSSRLDGTGLLVRTFLAADRPPRVLVNASAIGYYGDRGDEILDESSPPGQGWLAGLCRRWEAATTPAEAAGIRTVVVRTGIVQAADGGALKAQLPAFKYGLGARLGHGRQWVSWISIEDQVGALLHLLDHEEVRGPVNLVAPNPVINAEYATTLARTLGRPAVLAAPAPALKVLLGTEMATEMLLSGQRVRPGVLEATGYSWAHPDLSGALRAVLGH